MASTAPSTPATTARACSLDAAARTDRMHEWEALRTDALISERVTEDAAVVVLERSADVKRRLDALIEAERDCCSFLRFHVTEEDEQIVVRVTSTAAED